MSEARNSWSSLKSFKSLKGIPRQVRIGGSRREDGIYFHASTVNTQPDLPTVFGTVYQKFQFVQWEVARQPAGTLFFLGSYLHAVIFKKHIIFLITSTAATRFIICIDALVSVYLSIPPKKRPVSHWSTLKSLNRLQPLGFHVSSAGVQSLTAEGVAEGGDCIVVTTLQKTWVTASE